MFLATWGQWNKLKTHWHIFTLKSERVSKQLLVYLPIQQKQSNTALEFLATWRMEVQYSPLS